MSYCIHPVITNRTFHLGNSDCSVCGNQWMSPCSNNQLYWGGFCISNHILNLSLMKYLVYFHSPGEFLRWWPAMLIDYKRHAAQTVFIPMFNGTAKVRVRRFWSRITVLVSKQTPWDNNYVILIVSKPLSRSISIQLQIISSRKRNS